MNIKIKDILSVFILRAKREVQRIVLGLQPRTIILVDLIKKPIIRVLFLVVLLIIVIFVSVGVTKNPNINKFGPLNYPSSQTISAEKMPSTKIAFSFPKDTKIPNTINVYKIENAGIDANKTFFDKVSRFLGATVSAEIKTFGQEKAYVINQDNFYFTGNLNTGYFSLTGKSAKTLDTTDEDSIKLSAWDFLSLTGLTNNVVNTPTVSYNNYLGQELGPSKNVLLSDVVTLLYQPVVNSVPLVGLGSTSSPLQILIDRKNKSVVRLDFSVPTVDTKTAGSYGVISLDDISKTKANGLSIISFSDKNGGQIANYNFSDLTLVDFNKITLSYYITPEAQGLLQPVFVLKGNATLKDGRAGIIAVILPAVKNIKTP